MHFLSSFCSFVQFSLPGLSDDGLWSYTAKILDTSTGGGDDNGEKDLETVVDVSARGGKDYG